MRDCPEKHRVHGHDGAVIGQMGESDAQLLSTRTLRDLTPHSEQYSDIYVTENNGYGNGRVVFRLLTPAIYCSIG
jgi:hypothetical protein